MPTSRPFAYNTGTTLAETIQVGSIAVGVGNVRYDENYGGLKWWGGPDEDLGYVIAHTVVAGNQPNPQNLPAFLGFYRSPQKTELSFVNMVNQFFNQNFTTGDQCKTYLNNNGYWTSWSGPVTTDLIVYLDASNTNSYPTSGNTWFDLTPQNKDATLINTPTFSPTFNGILQFDDTSFQYATIPNLGGYGQWTVEVWFRVTTSLNSKISSLVCNQFDGANLNFSIGTNQAPFSYNLCVGFYDGAWRNTSGFVPNLNTWYQVVGTYDGSVIRQYINGVASGGTLNYVGTLQSGGEIRIMRRWDSPSTIQNLIDGDLSIIRIYDSALNPADITTNFNSDKARFGL